MTDDIHSCSYYCDRPACIKAQRDELVRKYVENSDIDRYVERYRWLRDIAWSIPAIPQQELPAVAVFAGSGRRCKDISGDEMDKAIDDAIWETSYDYP